MPTYIMLAQPHAGGRADGQEQPAADPRGQPRGGAAGREGEGAVGDAGRFDFVNILEAPDEQTMARVSLELGSRGTGALRDADGDTRRRLHRIAVSMKVLVVGSGGASTRWCGRWRAPRRQPELLCAPGNAGIAQDARLLDVAADDVRGSSRRSSERASISPWSGPRRRWWRASWTRSTARGRRPSARAPPPRAWRARRRSPSR